MSLSDSYEGGHSECIFSTLFLFTERPYYEQSEEDRTAEPEMEEEVAPLWI